MFAGPPVLYRGGDLMQVTYESAVDLAQALRRAEAAHGKY
jgi:hypothetical protein